MDADDLVITLKKSLAKLSRTERRKAVELVGGRRPRRHVR